MKFIERIVEWSSPLIDYFFPPRRRTVVDMIKEGEFFARVARDFQKDGFSYCECGKNYAYCPGGKHRCPDCL